MSEQPATKLYTALLLAAKDFSAVVKNKQNPHLKNYYADLGAVLEAVTEPLANHGLLIVQRFGGDQAAPVLIAELVHAESGQMISSALPIICKDLSDPQKLGGAITYARRYSLMALLNLAAEDDDGNGASQPPANRSQPRAESAPRQQRQAPPQQAPAPAPQPTPAASTDDLLLLAIRDDFDEPDARKKALHQYYTRAQTPAELNQRVEQVKLSGIPKDDLQKAYAWHHSRIAQQLAPAGYSG